MSRVDADRTPSARCNAPLAIEIKPVLLPMSRPTFLEGACLRCRSDAKSTERQD